MKGYQALVLSEQAQSKLLANVNAVFHDVIAHHVTLAFGVGSSKELPDVDSITVTHVAQNDLVQAVVVKVNGTNKREDNMTFHVTVSLDRQNGASPKDSNSMLANESWTAIEMFDLDVQPKFIPFNG